MASTKEENLTAALRAWNALKAGEEPIVSDAVIDALIDHFKAEDGPEADIYFRHTCAPHNPEQVGTLDGYRLRITDKGRAALQVFDAAPAACP